MPRITLCRWHIEFYQRAIHITREPNPNCPDCQGSRGGWAPLGLDGDWVECHCLDQLRTWRLPLAPPPDR